MKLSKFIFFFLFLVFTLSFISSAPPSSTTTVITDRGIDIVHPETLFVKFGDNLEFNFWTYNSTDGATLTNSSLNCTLYLVNSSGNQYYRFSNQPGASGLITYGKGAPLCVNCWTMNLSSGDLPIGSYSYQIKCQGSGVGGYYTGFFDVTATGIQMGDFSQNTILIGLLLLAFIFILFGAYFKISSLGFIGSVFLLLSGIYLMIYGFDGVANFYTQGIALGLIGLGFIFMFVSAYEWSPWGKVED